MGKRQDNKEVTYLRDETQRRLIELCRTHPTLNSKSRAIETALEFYLDMADQYGIDDRWRPLLPRGHQLAADIRPHYITTKPLKGGSEKKKAG